jgi:hypothetical protein
MCCTLLSAQLSNTILYAHQTTFEGRDIHVLGYQNTAESLAGPNAMILPIPAAAPLTSENMLDTRASKGVLKEYAKLVQPPQPRGLSKGMLLGVAAADSYQVFDKGSYTVVIAQSCGVIPKALQQVPENKRPAVSTSFLLAYAQIYPGMPIAVCCWDGRVEAEPIMWWYEPKNKERLFLPALDAHDGRPPDLDAKVHVDHTVVWGVERGINVPKSLYTGPLEPFLARNVQGRILHGRVHNGDFWVDLSAGTLMRETPRATA